MFDTSIESDIQAIVSMGWVPQLRRNVAKAVASLEKRRTQNIDRQNEATQILTVALSDLPLSFEERKAIANEAVKESAGWCIRHAVRSTASEARKAGCE